MKTLSLILLWLIIIIDLNSSKSQTQSQSSNKISIIVPKATAMDIDFGLVSKGNTKDSVFAGYIKNIGKPPVRIDKIEVKGKNADEFLLLTNIFPYSISSNSNKNIEFRFKPKTLGKKISKIIIFSQTDTLSYDISGECVEPKIEVISGIIDFGKISIFSQSDKSVPMAIKNVGTSQLRINSVIVENPVYSQFQLIDKINGFSLAPGEAKELNIRFNPEKDGRTDGRIVVTYENQTEPAVIKLYGEGSTVYATIKGTIKDVTGNPLEAKVGWELMTENFKAVELGNTKSTERDGSYEFKLPIGSNYAFYIEKQGFLGMTENAILKDEKAEKTIIKNVVLKKSCEGMANINVFFEFGKWDLKPESFSDLERLIVQIKENPEATVEISGHTDNVGSDEANRILSEKRAQSVVAFLVNNGCNKAKLTAKGYGKTKPVADNNTEKGQAENRRVMCEFNCRK